MYAFWFFGPYSKEKNQGTEKFSNLLKIVSIAGFETKQSDSRAPTLKCYSAERCRSRPVPCPSTVENRRPAEGQHLCTALSPHPFQASPATGRNGCLLFEESQKVQLNAGRDGGILNRRAGVLSSVLVPGFTAMALRLLPLLHACCLKPNLHSGGFGCYGN